MKKLTFIFALLCASVMGWAGVSEGEYISSTDPTYNNQFKWYSILGKTAPMEVVNFQDPHGLGLYLNVGTAAYDGVKYNGISSDGFYKQDAGVWLFVGQFTARCTTVEIVNGENVVCAFRVLNEAVEGEDCPTGSGGEDPEEPEEINWNEVSWLTNSNENFKVVVSPAGPTISQEQDWKGRRCIYVTYADANFGACSLDASLHDTQGAGKFYYTSAFLDQETEFTQIHNGTTYTFTVFNAHPVTVPASKASTPTVPTSRVKGVYSMYDFNTGYSFANWCGNVKQSSALVDGRNIPFYQMGNSCFGMEYRYIDVSNMTKIHLDIWTENTFNINFYLISPSHETYYTISLTGGEWNAVDIPLSTFTAAGVALNNVFQFKFDGPSIADQTIFVDNIYFYAETDVDPEPSEEYDVNFALQTKGAIAAATSPDVPSAALSNKDFAKYAIDNDNGTRWQSDASDAQTLTVDLGQRRIFNTVQIRWEGAYASAFTIDVSNDNSTWTTVKTVTGQSLVGFPNEQIYDFAKTTARYIRFNGTTRASGYGYSFYEFRVLLTGTPVLTYVDISSDKTITKVGEYATLTVAPKDQNGSSIVADLSYTVSPADAGHVADGKYYPLKYGLATITVTATTSNAEVSNSVQIWGVTSTNLAANKALSTDGSYTSDGGTSYLPGNAVDENYDTWWQGSVNGEGGGASEEARTYEAYFAVDLGNTYNVQLVVINFEGACSEQYNLQFSNNNEDWINGYAYSGNYSGTHVEYISSSDMNNSDAVRYIRFFSTKAKTQYGIKMFEFRVYGTEASTTKTVSASVLPIGSGNVTVTKTETGDPVEEVEAGTEVTFTATPAEGYDFVNWTQGGDVIPGAGATYTTTINGNTSLVANFEDARTAYCHTPVTDTQGRTLYLSISKTDNENEYKIMLEGSENNKIRGNNVYVGTGLRLRNVNGNTSDAGYHFSNGDGIWTVVERDDNSYGSASVTFTATNFRDISFANKGVDLFRDNSQGGNDLSSFNAFPDAEYIKWDSECSDTEAPEFVKAEAAVLGATSVRLLLQATDNWQINVEYTISRAGADDIVLHGATGEELSQDITGLTAGTEYTFNVTVSDGNMSNSRQIKVTPAGDVTAPTNVTISAVALTDHVVRLTLSADDDYAGDVTYNIAYDNAGVASTSAPRGETTTLDIAGLEADVDYHFVVVATDAANNSSAAVNASNVRTFAANLALNRPCTAGHETGSAGEVKEKSNDGDKASRWSSYGSINKGTLDTEDWWAVELDGVYDIRNLRLSWQDARSDNMNVYVSMDGEHWDFVQNFDFMPESSANGETYTNYELTGATGRYVKVLSLHDYFNGQWGISFWELEVYGTPAEDGVAPVISSFTADGASTSSVLLKATATDNFNGDLTYTFYCNDVAQGEPIVKASGVEATYTVTGLTMGMDYNFKVNVSDGTNNTMSDVVVGSPISDNAAPENVTVTSEATDYSITLTLSATDNLGGMIYYTVTCGETVKNAEALSGEQVNVLFDGLDYDTPYAFSVFAKDGSKNAADAVAHNKSTLPATYPTSYAPAPAFAEASVRPVFSSAYNKDCNFYDWGGSWIEKQTYGAKKATFDKAYFGIADFGTIKLDADDELYLSVWTNENISFKVVPIIRNAENTANLPERGAFTQTLTGGQWNVVRFTMSDFVLDDADAVVEPNENYDRIYQIKIDRAQNQTFWLDNIYFRRHGALNETDNAEFIAANNNEGQDITIPRTFPQTDEWYTLCLPFDLSDEQLVEAFGAGYTLATLATSEDHGSLISLNFDFVHSFEAGKAYLLRPGTAVTENPVFEGVVVKNVDPVAATSTYMNFQGTFNTIVLDNENQRFVGPENYLYSPAEGGTSMKAFRCFFTIPQNSPLNGAPAKPARIVFGEQTATGMESVQGDNVQGTKVLMDGQLFIIREGRIYNAQGTLVK